MDPQAPYSPRLGLGESIRGWNLLATESIWGKGVLVLFLILTYGDPDGLILAEKEQQDCFPPPGVSLPTPLFRCVSCMC